MKSLILFYYLRLLKELYRLLGSGETLDVVYNITHSNKFGSNPFRDQHFKLDYHQQGKDCRQYHKTYNDSTVILMTNDWQLAEDESMPLKRVD